MFSRKQPFVRLESTAAGPRGGRSSLDAERDMYSLPEQAGRNNGSYLQTPFGASDLTTPLLPHHSSLEPIASQEIDTPFSSYIANGGLA